MTIDSFYKIIHLSMTLLIVAFIINIWWRYIKISKENKDQKNSYSLLLFACALLLWEYNLFDNDYRYEVITSLVVDGMLLTAIAYFSNGALLNSSIAFLKMVKLIPFITVGLIVLSNILINCFSGYVLIGYSLVLLYTFFTFGVLSYRIFSFFRNRNLIEIGIMSYVFFITLYISIILSIIYFDTTTPTMFAWVKILYLIATFGVYITFTSLFFNFLQDFANQKFLRVFSSAHTDNNSLLNIKNLNYSTDRFNELVAEDKIEELVEILLNTFKNNNDILTSILMLANQLSGINKDKLRNVITDSEYRVSRNRIVNSIIELNNQK